MRQGLLCVVACWLFLARADVQAAEDMSTATEANRTDAEAALNRIFQLYQVDLVSTGSFLDVTQRQSPASLSIITHEQIMVSGARNLSELLEIYVPGFHYSYSKWHSAPMWGMRGFAIQDLAFIFLVNGARQNVQSRTDPAVEAALGLLQDVERVEVLRGPAGLTYGAAGLAGVINVVTRTPPIGMADLRVAAGPRTIETQLFGNARFADDNALSLSAGFTRDTGVGLHASRIYGQGSYPSPALIHPDGIPSEGSALATPGNLRVGFDWRFHELRVWGRWTRQRLANGGFFAQDPWPAIVGTPPAGTPAGLIDGAKVSPTGPWGQVDSLGLGRALFAVDNFTAAAHYELHFDSDRLALDLAWNGVSDRIAQDLLNAFAVPTALQNLPAGMLYLTFGERRYSASATYLLKRVPNLQSGSGVQLRFDDMGPDLEGFNFYNGIAKHTAITPVVYTNLALFSENMYWFSEQLAVVLGLRLDVHTRAGAQFNPKLAVMYFPNDDHVVKLIAQSSTGNNGAFNYEYNYYRYSDDGTVNTTSSLASATGTTVIPPVSLATLRALQPERSLSIELTSAHHFFDVLSIMPSISYNRILNVFEFSNDLFRSVNVGQYDALDVEVDVLADLDYVRIGANHTFQRPFVFNAAPQTFQVPKTRVSPGPNNTFTVTEIPGQTQAITVDVIGESITADGQNFINLSTHVSKLWATVNPLSWLTLHANLRVFWALAGRHVLWAADEAKGENYLNADTMPMIKLNAGAVVNLPWGFAVSAFAYDLLGGGRSRNGVRWQQHPLGDFKEIYTPDQPTFMVQVEKSI